MKEDGEKEILTLREVAARLRCSKAHVRRTFATLSKQAGIDAHTRSAQMGNTVDVNENEYAVASFEQKLAAVRRFETVADESDAGSRTMRLSEGKRASDFETD